MAAKNRERRPDLVVTRKLPDGTEEKHIRFGPHVFVLPPPGPGPKDARAERRECLRSWRVRALWRTMAALKGRLGLTAAAVMARRMLNARFRKWMDEDARRGLLLDGPQILNESAELAVRLIREALFGAAGMRAAEGDALPPVRALPPGVWMALDLVAELAERSGGLAEAERQAREILAGVRVQEGGREGARRVRRGPPAGERLAAWRAELDRERRPDGILPHGAVARIARTLARRHRTKPEAERRFAYDHAGELGLPERRRRGRAEV